MREVDEFYTDSEPGKESAGISRGTALKVGGLGLAGALAAFLPGRAGAAVSRHTSNASCAGTGFLCLGQNVAKACGYSPSTSGFCYCGELYYGKIRPKGSPVGACVENFFCQGLTIADACNGQRDCAAGYACISDSCCTLRFKGTTYRNFCFHYCEQGPQPTPPGLTTPKTAAHR